MNDIANGPGINVSFWVQGCRSCCPHCHNPETWDFDGGKEFTSEVLDKIEEALVANGIKRGLSILGGEPLDPRNLFLTELVIREIRKDFPDIKINLWTGYTYEELQKQKNKHIDYILSQLSLLVDGPYIHEERDITLPMRGSRNQRIIDMEEINGRRKNENV